MRWPAKMRGAIIAAAMALLAAAPSQAVVIQSGQVDAGQSFFVGEELQPGETRQYELDVSGGPLERASFTIVYRFVEYRRLDANTLWSTSLNLPTVKCVNVGDLCLTGVPSQLLPFTSSFTISAIADQGSLADCDLPSAVGGGVCFVDAFPTLWSFNAQAGGPTSFTLSLVPEPSTWALLIIGFGVIGGSARRSRRLQRRLA